MGTSSLLSQCFPQEVNLYFRTLPHFFTDQEIITAIKLPINKQTSPIKRHTVETEDGFIYDGGAVCKLLVETKEELAALKNWAEENCTAVFSLHEITFYGNIPSLLECQFCQSAGGPFKGHHVSYCHKKKTEEYKRKATEAKIKESQNTNTGDIKGANENDATERKTTEEKIIEPKTTNGNKNKPNENSVSTGDISEASENDAPTHSIKEIISNIRQKTTETTKTLKKNASYKNKENSKKVKGDKSPTKIGANDSETESSNENDTGLESLGRVLRSKRGQNMENMRKIINENMIISEEESEPNASEIDNVELQRTE